MKSLTLVLFLAVFSYAGFGQNATPKIRDVVKEFYGMYSTTELDYGQVAFEKRKEGWYVVTQKISGYELVPAGKYLFYSNTSKKYADLPILQKSNSDEVEPSEYMNNYELVNFDLQLYFGYDGWYKDVINELKDKPQLSDDELYALGRAYSAYACDLTSDNSGYAVPGEIWKLPFNINCLSRGQLKAFRSLDNKAIACFKKLAGRNPAYETAVGKIGMKHANEVMYQYQVLLAYANDFATALNLPQDLYSNEQLEAAKRNLESCPRDAILFSFGDNDYYPVHFLQKVKGIRRDVYILNFSLLGVDRYIYRATFPQYEAKPIQLSVDTTLYVGRKNELIFVKDSAFSFPAPAISELLRKGVIDESTRITLHAKEVLLSNSPSTETGGVSVGIQAVVSLKDVRYLYRNNWILLDILENLRGRKICFPNDFEDELKGLNNHLVRRNGLWVYNN